MHICYLPFFICVQENNVSAQTDLNNALAIDRYNTTARKYLNEMGENPDTVPEKRPADALKPDNENLRNVRPVDHYEDPNKETWKQFVYMLINWSCYRCSCDVCSCYS